MEIGGEDAFKCKIARKGLLESATFSSSTVIVIDFKSQLNRGIIMTKLPLNLGLCMKLEEMLPPSFLLLGSSTEEK